MTSAPTRRGVLGILGMPGSGKSILAGTLAAAGVPIVRLGQFVVDEVMSRGIPRDSAGEAIVRHALREEEGQEVLAKRALSWINEHPQEQFLVVDGVYSPHEDEFFRTNLSHAYFTLAVVCDRETRYQRIGARDHRPFTEAEAIERDRHELEVLRKAEPIVLADYFCLNNSDPASYLRSALATVTHHLDAMHEDSSELPTARMPLPELLSWVKSGSLENTESSWAVFARALIEDDAYLTWHVAREVGRLRLTRGKRFLLETGARPDRPFEDETSLHLIAAWALGQVGCDLGDFVRMQDSPEASTRRFVADSLGEAGLPSAYPVLLRMLRDDSSDDVAMWAALSIAKVVDKAGGRLSFALRDLEAIIRSRSSSSLRKTYAFDAHTRIDRVAASLLFDEIVATRALPESATKVLGTILFVA